MQSLRSVPELNRLLDVIVGKAKASEARDWLKSNVAPDFAGKTPEPPSHTLPIIIFLAVMIPTTIGLVVILTRRNKPGRVAT
jgi:hypothetical protein